MYYTRSLSLKCFLKQNNFKSFSRLLDRMWKWIMQAKLRGLWSPYLDRQAGGFSSFASRGSVYAAYSVFW